MLQEQKEAQAAGWTRDQIAQKAAERLAQNYLHKAAKRRQRAQQQIVAQAALENNREKYERNGEKAFKSVGRVLEDVSRYMIGLQEQYQGQIVDAISSIQSKWFGLMEDRKTALDFVKEHFLEKILGTRQRRRPPKYGEKKQTDSENVLTTPAVILVTSEMNGTYPNLMTCTN